MSNGPIIPHDLAVQRLQDALRILVGRGKKYSVQGVAEATGIKARTIESYLSGDATPGMNGLLSLCSVLGPSFTSDVLAPCGQVARAADTDAPEYMRAISMMGEGCSILADALADGYVDHQERARIKPFAVEILPVIQAMASASDTCPIPFPDRAS